LLPVIAVDKGMEALTLAVPQMAAGTAFLAGRDTHTTGIPQRFALQSAVPFANTPGVTSHCYGTRLGLSFSSCAFAGLAAGLASSQMGRRIHRGRNRSRREAYGVLERLTGQMPELSVPDMRFPEWLHDTFGNAPTQPCFEVRSIPGKGMGVIATRNISAGEQIAAEMPSLAFCKDGQVMSKAEQAQLQILFDELEACKQQGIMSLADSHAEEGQTKTLQGIIRTNMFRIPPEEGIAFNSAVFVGLSRFNHSCVPNCEQSWDPKRGEMHIYAHADIPAGEELCICYMEVRAPTKERRDHLEAAHGFLCGCPACTGATSKSDQRRTRMLELDHELVASSTTCGVQAAEEILDLCRTEGIHLQSIQMRACHFAFRSAFTQGDRMAAQQWALRAHEHSRNCHGPKHPRTQMLLSCVEA